MQHTVTLSVAPKKPGDLETFHVVTVDAPTDYAAANLAEVQIKHETQQTPKLLSVATHRFVLGRCKLCQSVVFIGDSVRQRRGELRCSDCP